MARKKRERKKSTFIHDFKAFITRGNVVDMAVGVIIGGAFGKIVSSLVNDMLMPLIGAMFNTTSIAELQWVFKEAIIGADGTILRPAGILRYGNFIQTIIDFLIIAFTIFLMIRALAKAKELGEKAAELAHRKKEEEEAANAEKVEEAPAAVEEVKAEPAVVASEDVADILKEIRDLIKLDKLQENKDSK
ncbi:MAG: large conductance mechanosensitive channel protein MscL [Clostridiales bacterium]|mgnify:CR=1 FL=1|jgi:large conductance mechanosensitive channel|nr:large conductance mechanosensitive channel protein MscL [Clostridiales bacterium]